jgi:hypothetical protein
MSRAAEAFETQPQGVPFRRRVLAGYGLALALGLLLTCAGLTIDAHLGGAAWQIPPLAPLAVLVGAGELVRVARWRSTRYVVLGHGLFVRRGVLLTSTITSADARGVLVRAWTSGPVIETPGGSAFVLEGLDPGAWDATADALRRAGATVAPGLAPPAEAAANRAGPSLRAVALLGLLALVVGSAAEWRARLDRARGAEHVGLAAQATAACNLAVADASVSLAKRRAREDCSFERANWVRAYVGQRTQSFGASLTSDETRLVLDVDWPEKTGPSPGRRTVAVVTCVRPWGLIPDRPRVTVIGDPADPFSCVVIAHVRARLAMAGVAHGTLTSE